MLSVKEYYLYDPDGLYLQPSLQGYRLADGIYSPIQPVDERLPSEVLGLELAEEDGELRLYNPLTKGWVLKPVEEEAKARRRAEAKVQQEFQARQHAETRAQHAEAELAQLQALLERLRATDE